MTPRGCATHRRSRRIGQNGSAPDESPSALGDAGAAGVAPGRPTRHTARARQCNTMEVRMSTAEASGSRAPGREFADAFLPEDNIVRVARELAADAEVTPIAPSAGATLAMLAAATSARAVIEV